MRVYATRGNVTAGFQGIATINSLGADIVDAFFFNYGGAPITITFQWVDLTGTARADTAYNIVCAAAGTGHLRIGGTANPLPSVLIFTVPLPGSVVYEVIARGV